tara:strand:+ start:7333 stop:7521 length:189 start_codon:yes stop_codon:yes gene_type:complete
MTLVLELDEAPDFEERLIYVAVSEMFNVDLCIDGADVELSGLSRDVLAWISFHLLPTEIIEA